MMSASESDVDSDDGNSEERPNFVATAEENDGIWHPSDIFQPMPVQPPVYSTRASVSAELEEPELKYDDLSEVEYFDPEEMQWAAEYIIQKQTEERLEGRDFGARSFARRYNISKSRVQHWVTKLKGGYGERGKKFYSCKGQPQCIDDIGMAVLSESIRNSSRLKTSMLYAKVREAVYEQRRNTFIRRGVLPPVGEIDPRTLTKIRKRLGAKKRKAQNMSDVRVRAASDIRNAFSLYVMLLAFAKHLWSCCIFNWDAVTFSIKKEGDKFVWCIPDPNEPPVTHSGAEELAMGIKWIPLISADGAISRVVLVIAVDGFDPDKFVYYPLQGLSCSSEGSAPPGYLCFCKTRAGNPAFWKWFLTYIIIPEVQQVRSRQYGKPILPDGTLMPIFIVIDGEAIQLDQVFSADVINILSEKLIIMGKLPASCSAIYQPCDVGPLFKIIKRIVKYLAENCVDVTQHHGVGNSMEFALEEIVAHFNENYGTSSNIRISRAKKEKLFIAITRLVYAFSNYVKVDQVKSGFIKSGIFPINFRNIVAQLYGKQYDNLVEYESLERKAPEAVPSFQSEGVLSEDRMTELGIRESPAEHNSLPRDQRALHNNRARILNIAATIAMVFQRRGLLDQQLHLNETIARSVQERMQVARTLKEVEVAKKAVEKNRKAEEKIRKAAEARQSKLDSMDEHARELFLRREEATRQRKQRQIEMTSGIVEENNINANIVAINTNRDLLISSAAIDDNDDACISTNSYDAAYNISSNTNINNNHVRNNNIENSRRSSSSSIVVNSNIISRTGRAILSLALPGNSYPCGCGCEKSYDGLQMVTCRGCAKLYVNKRCNVTWKCEGCSA